MLIDEKALKHWIDNFYGYGSWQSRMWFIGYEESGGEVPEEVAEKVDYFYKAHPFTTDGTLCDIRELYRHVAVRWDPSSRNATKDKASVLTNRYEYRFAGNAIQNGVWKNLIAFVHGYRNEELPDLLEYQKNTFASSHN